MICKGVQLNAQIGSYLAQRTVTHDNGKSRYQKSRHWPIVIWKVLPCLLVWSDLKGFWLGFMKEYNSPVLNSDRTVLLEHFGYCLSQSQHAFSFPYSYSLWKWSKDIWIVLPIFQKIAFMFMSVLLVLCVPGAHGGQKRMMDSMELEL